MAGRRRARGLREAATGGQSGQRRGARYSGAGAVAAEARRGASLETGSAGRSAGALKWFGKRPTGLSRSISLHRALWGWGERVREVWRGWVREKRDADVLCGLPLGLEAAGEAGELRAHEYELG
jgi:hypothetical protein